MQSGGGEPRCDPCSKTYDEDRADGETTKQIVDSVRDQQSVMDSVLVQLIEQPRELAVNGFMSSSELLVLSGNVAVNLVVRHMLGMGCFVFMFVARMLMDLALLPNDLRFVGSDHLLMFQ
ncbi:MAG TPA: hypothetical protein ACFCUY_04155 [Xenococcaceae cyanobacterium]